MVYRELKKGRNANIEDPSGFTPLMLACKAEQERLTREATNSSTSTLTDVQRLSIIKESYQAKADTPLGSALLLLRYGARLDTVN